MIEWFGDVRVGTRFKTGQKLVSREDIKRFAAELDPQPYHLDEAAAEQSFVQGARRLWMAHCRDVLRLAVEGGLSGRIRCWALVSMSCSWLAPVHPGDVLRLEGEVTEVTPSKTRPQGIVKVKWRPTIITTRPCTLSL